MVWVRVLYGFEIDDWEYEDEDGELDIGTYTTSSGETLRLEEGFANELAEDGYVEILKEEP